MGVDLILADPVTGIAAAAIITSLATTGVQAYQANEARNDAKKAASQQQEDADRLLAEQEAEQERFEQEQLALEDQNNQENQRVARRDQRVAGQRGQGGRSSTILTDPLGAVNDRSAENSAKTLLGI